MSNILKSKKVILSIAFSMLTAICVGAVIFINTPRNYMAIDINPSIEIQTNLLNKVVRVNAANEDAQKLLTDMNLNGRGIEDAVKSIIERLIEKNYITQGADNEILLTVGNSSTSEELISIVNNTITKVLESKQLTAKLIDQRIEINDKVLDTAHQNNISAGKQSVIEKIVANNENVTIEELSSTKISDLLEYAKKNNVELENVIEAYVDAIEKAMDNDKADKVDKDDDEDDDDDDDDDDEDDEDDDDKKGQAPKNDVKTDSIKDSQKNQNVNSAEKNQNSGNNAQDTNSNADEDNEDEGEDD